MLYRSKFKIEHSPYKSLVLIANYFVYEEIQKFLGVFLVRF